MFKNILVSVSDKTGLVDFIKPYAAKGARVVSTGGTSQHLRDHGIKVVDVSEQTGFPEIMDGRVKTLHPKIHMGLLARSFVPGDAEILKSFEVEPFDLVIVNLYPFEAAQKSGKTGQDLVEYIDIGGPSLLRGAAKSFERLAVVCDPQDYSWISSRGVLSLEERKRLAAKVYAHTSAYDHMIAQALSGSAPLQLQGDFVAELRYGENPQQTGLWYAEKSVGTIGLHHAEFLQGKALSYNNIMDLDAATRLVVQYSNPACVAVKHNNPCGGAVGKTLNEAVVKCLASDPVSVFGGIIACNGVVGKAEAELFSNLFLECILAPDVTKEALEVFSKKKNLRVLKFAQMAQAKQSFEVRSVLGGLLVQGPDIVDAYQNDWEVIGQHPPKEIQESLELAWRVAASLKSNSIAIVSGLQTVGLGMGQVNRVEAVEHALARMQKHHPECKNPVLASDAFFPFEDSIELICKSGIKWCIQPGGSMRDDEVKKAAQRLGLNMILTKKRHFKH